MVGVVLVLELNGSAVVDAAVAVERQRGLVLWLGFERPPSLSSVTHSQPSPTTVTSTTTTVLLRRRDFRRRYPRQHCCCCWCHYIPLLVSSLSSLLEQTTGGVGGGKEGRGTAAASYRRGKRCSSCRPRLPRARRNKKTCCARQDTHNAKEQELGNDGEC